MASNVPEVNKMIMALAEVPPSMPTWLEWEWKLTQAIKYSNVWTAVMQRDAGGNPPGPPLIVNLLAPSAVEQAHLRTWNEQRACATRWITTAAGRLNADISDKYQTNHDAPALLAELEARFFPKDVNAQLAVLRNLFLLPKSSEEPWEQYFTKQDDAAKRFSQVFPTGIPTDRLKELLFMLNTLGHLPTTHPIRTNALAPNSSATSEGVRASIRAHIAQDGVEPPTAGESASRAGTETTRKCLFCNYNNHLIADCRFAKFYLKAFEIDRDNRTGPFANRGRGSNRSGRGGRSRGGNRANQAIDEGIVDAPFFEESAGNEPPKA
ncbi:hypothetical protein FRC15_005840 [Serendipita sp. 397]|nr:hypothetical protein FRC15_005840 [Serendipita sp. 397]KAG8772637.1 hypothetical protein FRC16_005620 [Serendipita sp. 398]